MHVALIVLIVLLAWLGVSAVAAFPIAKFIAKGSK